ncbi:MAG TPA: sce7726 family protein [Candidatus Obscuribacterales bacterium]
MNDLEIRTLLHCDLIKLRLSDPSTLIIDELGIFEGSFRIDVAVVNGSLHGFEIKSAGDNLDRLPSQQAAYNKVFDRLTLVADEHHVTQAMKILPPWWGLTVAGMRNGVPYVEELWQPRMNNAVDPYALCQLLWRDEALKILARKKMSAGLWSKSRKVMWRKLAKELELEELKLLVRETLKNRSGWRK